MSFRIYQQIPHLSRQKAEIFQLVPSPKHWESPMVAEAKLDAAVFEIARDNVLRKQEQVYPRF